MNTLWTRRRKVVGCILVMLALGLAVVVVGRGPSAQPPDPYTAWAATAQEEDEIVQERSRFSKVYQVSPDVRMVRISSSPVHFRASTGWEEIDLTVRPAAPGSEYSWEAVRNEPQVFFKQQAEGTGYLVKYAARGGEIEFGVEPEQSWGRLQPVQAQVQGNQVLYPNLFPGSDLRYEISSPSRLWEEIVIQDAATARAITSVEKRFSARNVAWHMEDGAIIFTWPGSGEVLWRVPAPVMYERGNPAVRSDGLHFEIEEHEGAVLLRKVLDPSGISWLQDKARQFPVAIDDTVDLWDPDAAVAHGDGWVSRTGGSGSCQGLIVEYAIEKTATENHVGCVAGSPSKLYRGFWEWGTVPVPDDPIQAIGLYLNVSRGYAETDRQLRFVGLSLEGVEWDDAETVYTRIGTGNEYVTVDDGMPPGTFYVNLGYRPTDAAIVDLQNDRIYDLPFDIGVMVLNDESSLPADYGSYRSYDYLTDADTHPELVIFYRGSVTTSSEPARPLRNTIWDGANFWMFYNITEDNIEYAYSPDGVAWTWVGTLPDTVAQSKHHAVWYDTANNRLYVAYHAQTGVPPKAFVGDLRLRVGRIDGTTITWNPDSWPSPFTTIFDASETNNEGYDFPSIVKGLDQYCWAASRWGTDTSPIAYAIRVARSSDTSCRNWLAPRTLLTGDVNELNDFLSVGGYLVPLGTNEAMVMFKDRDEVNDRNPIWWRKCNSSGNCPGINTQLDDNAAPGVYMYGLSLLGIGSEAHVVYIDLNTNGSPVLKYKAYFGSGWTEPIGAMEVPLPGVQYYSPSLSLDQDGVYNHVYLFYRTDTRLAPTPTPGPHPGQHSANAVIYYRKGMRPGTGQHYNWSPPIEAAFQLWGPVDSVVGDYPLFSNYTSQGDPLVSTQRRILGSWTEAIYGVDSIVITPTPPP